MIKKGGLVGIGVSVIFVIVLSVTLPSSLARQRRSKQIWIDLLYSDREAASFYDAVEGFLASNGTSLIDEPESVFVIRNNPDSANAGSPDLSISKAAAKA